MIKSNNESNTNWNIAFLCWIIASASTLGSFFFSEVMELPPCALCWYQRIFMFPLAVIFLVGLFPFDKTIIKYALPLALIGWAIAFYHFLLYTGFIPESIQPCSQGVSCSETYLDLFGFITIPLLSLLSFSTISTLLYVLRTKVNK
ncbi:disulfide bond formation protein B [Desulfosarcina alkanivorans]|jgi:disulfide bond formation protein DsbB|uniref:disulfide bond formation protein B n=1 Tax=Desulfosarcina alkanivorans TaxID=571177 RepID=UPI0012D35F32|nr:disulfide bond formation protein B [Desulfosarcina alkanivorans]